MLSILIVIVSCHHCNPVDPPAPICSVSFDLNSTSAYEISVAPAMPAISTTLTNKVPTSATLSWSANITHTAPSGCGNTNLYVKTVTGSGDSFSPSFGGFYGGNLTVTATCSAAGYYSNTSTKTNTVIGTQPTDNAIVSEIGTVSTPYNSADLRKIGCHESSLTQFLSNGQPFYAANGAKGDPGIMQTCSGRTNEFIWNWHANIARARFLLLGDMKNGGKTHLDHEVTVEGATPYPTNYWRDEGIHRYNAGPGSGNEYREWDNINDRWVIVERGGVLGGYVWKVDLHGASCT